MHPGSDPFQPSQNLNTGTAVFPSRHQLEQFLEMCIERFQNTWSWRGRASVLAKMWTALDSPQIQVHAVPGLPRFRFWWHPSVHQLMATVEIHGTQ